MAQKPTHNVHFVQDIGASKPFWRRIGAAWEHQSGRGLSIKLDLIPVDFTSGDIVILEVSERPEADNHQNVA